jgi:hypothetical protein
MLLMVAGTICIAIIIAIICIGVTRVVRGDRHQRARSRGAVLNTLVGLLAGYLAGAHSGRRSASVTMQTRCRGAVGDRSG